jgi:hypothetical protein
VQCSAVQCSQHTNTVVQTQQKQEQKWNAHGK